MKKLKPAFLLAALFLLASGQHEKKPVRVLVFSKTAGYRHQSIADGKKAILKLAGKNYFFADTSENASVFTDDSLAKYDAVIFLNTTGDILDSVQQAAFERFIRSGKGFVGIHAATDTEYEWPWYVKLVGASFADHPKTQPATLNVVDNSHISTRHLPPAWNRTDEWYNFKDQHTSVNVVMTIDEKSYTGGTNGDQHPMAWYHEYDGGRAFYTALGHTPESYSEKMFLDHLLGGIKYATGKNE